MFELDVSAPNITPGRYRQVAVAEVDSLAPADLIAHFTGREAYRRTSVIVARRAGACALVEIGREDSDDLFSEAAAVRVLAEADDCAYARDETVDTAIASHLAAVADRYPTARCVVVEGRYAHVSFIMNAAPGRIEVVDIVPPEPSKLVDQVRRVIDSAEDLTPVVVSERIIDSRGLLHDARPELPSEVLVPCRGGEVDIRGARVAHLDQRPARRDWTLLGCRRSEQIHEWFYGEAAADTVDTCPRRVVSDLDDGIARLSRCCLTESGLEVCPGTVWVPWGASLREIREGLDRLVAMQGVLWTHI